MYLTERMGRKTTFAISSEELMWTESNLSRQFLKRAAARKEETLPRVLGP